MQSNFEPLWSNCVYYIIDRIRKKDHDIPCVRVATAFCSCMSICCSWRICVSNVLSMMNISCRYIKAHWNITVAIITSISRWNIFGAIFKRNVIQVNSFRSLLEVRTVLSLFLSSIFSCQYPLLVSRVETFVGAEGNQYSRPLKAFRKSRFV